VEGIAGFGVASIGRLEAMLELARELVVEEVG
jgi:hypothetical protein